LRNSICNVINW